MIDEGIFVLYACIILRARDSFRRSCNSCRDQMRLWGMQSPMNLSDQGTRPLCRLTWCLRVKLHTFSWCNRNNKYLETGASSVEILKICSDKFEPIFAPETFSWNFSASVWELEPDRAIDGSWNHHQIAKSQIDQVSERAGILTGDILPWKRILSYVRSSFRHSIKESRSPESSERYSGARMAWKSEKWIGVQKIAKNVRGKCLVRHLKPHYAKSAGIF